MPLLIVTGLPCTGKSTTAKELQEYIATRLKQDGQSSTIRIVSDSELLDWDGRDTIYSSIAKEKELRGWLKSESQRYINLQQIVILDASTYIKGYRYELFCIAKEAKTRYCIIEKLIDKQVIHERNQARIDSGQRELAYSKETIEALMMRYEPCDSSDRWDNPLIRLESEKEQLDMSDIYDKITKDPPLAPNKCTSLASTTKTIFNS